MVDRISFKWYGSTNDPSTDCRRKWFSLKAAGLSMALLSALIGSFKGLLVNKLAAMGPIEIFCARSLGTSIIIFPSVILSMHKIFPDRNTIKWLVLRAIAGNIAVTGYYFGFVYLPMGIASAIYYSCPLYTAIFGKIFLNEAFGMSECMAVIMSLLGLILVTQPWTFGSGLMDPNTILGLAGSFVGAIAQAGAFVLLRKLEAVPTTIVTFYWSAIGTILSAVIVAATRTFRFASCGLDGVMVVSVSLLGTLSELCMTFALSRVEANKASVALTSEIIWAFVFQYCIEKTAVSFISASGGVCVVLAIVLPCLASNGERLRYLANLCLPIRLKNYSFR